MTWDDCNNVARQFLDDSTVLDDDTTDRLLGGGIHPDDAPPGFEPVARLFTIAAPSPDDLDPASAAATVTKMLEVVGDAGVSAARRSGSLRRLLAVKLAAAAGAVVLSTGVAGATGSLPGPLQDAIAEAVSHVGLELPGSAAEPGGAGKPDRSSGVGGGQPGLPSVGGGEDKATGRPDGEPAADSGREGLGSETSNWVQDRVHEVEGPKGPDIAPCLSGEHSQAGSDEPDGDAQEPDCSLPPAEKAPRGGDAGDNGAGHTPVDGKARAGEASGGARGSGPENAGRP